MIICNCTIHTLSTGRTKIIFIFSLMLFYKVIASPQNLQMLLIHSLEIHLPLSMFTKNGKAK